MEKDTDINLKYRYEKVSVTKRPLSNPIERFGDLASQVVQFSPSLIPNLAFGHSEYISGGILDPGLIVPQQKIESQPENIRIRCIEDSSGPLVEFFYDKYGRFDEIVLLNSFKEKYTWSEDNKLISLQGRNAEMTQFKYQKDGLLASIIYPDGSIFRYEYDHLKQLSAITYPDGVAVKYTRNALGLLTCAECRDGAFEYLWDDRNRLQELSYKNASGEWRVKPGEINKKIRFDCKQSTTGLTPSVSSALGTWRYDKNGALCEMFIPSGERFVKISSEEGSEVLSWSNNGQTAYRFDKSGILMGMMSSMGANTAFKRVMTGKQVILTSVLGIAVLSYDKNGNLQSERDQQGEGAAYIYTPQGILKSIGLSNRNIDLTWFINGTLESIKCENFHAFIVKKNLNPTNMNLKLSNIKYSEAMDVFFWLFWHWEALKIVRRIQDITLKK